MEAPVRHLRAARSRGAETSLAAFQPVDHGGASPLATLSGAGRCLSARRPGKPGLEDLQRVEYKLRLYDLRPRAVVFITAVEAYALCKQGKTRDGERMFADAKKADKNSPALYLFRGWSKLEREKYTSAKADLQMALQVSNKNPQAEVHEAMAILLAACPTDRVRNGESAVAHAAKACAWRSRPTGFVLTRWEPPMPRPAISTRPASGRTRHWTVRRQEARSRYGSASPCMKPKHLTASSRTGSVNRSNLCPSRSVVRTV